MRAYARGCGIGKKGGTGELKIGVLGGVLLSAVSAYGIVHGTRAGLAQSIYHEVKFAKDAEMHDPLAVSMRCNNAHRLYPHNYFFCIWIAEKAYYNRFGPDGREIQEYLRATQHWCDTGLELNFYNSQLRLLKTRLLKRESVSDAVEYWEKYVDWQFWEPYNHAMLVELYAASGDFGKAMESLTWVKGSRHYSHASRKLHEAWQKEMAGE